MKLDFAETLVLVVTVYFIGIVFYIHAATYGSGGFLVSRNMAGFCYVGEEMRLVPSDSVSCGTSSMRMASFANPIEPSSNGGQKIAESIAGWVKRQCLV